MGYLGGICSRHLTLVKGVESTILHPRLGFVKKTLGKMIFKHLQTRKTNTTSVRPKLLNKKSPQQHQTCPLGWHLHGPFSPEMQSFRVRRPGCSSSGSCATEGTLKTCRSTPRRWEMQSPSKRIGKGGAGGA